MTKTILTEREQRRQRMVRSPSAPPKKVWLAYSGWYEDRRPYAAFTTQELAEADWFKEHGPFSVEYEWADSDGNHGPEVPVYPDVEEIELKA